MSLFSRLFAKPWRQLPFAEVASRLKATLQADPFPQGVLQRQLGSLHAALAIDDRGAPALVEDHDAERWRQQADSLWTLAHRNLAADAQLLARPYELPSPIPVTVQLITSENEFAAGRLLLLDQLTGASEGGAIVAVPARNLAMFLPLPDPAALIANVLMIVTAASLFDEGKAAVSPHLYWWRAGRFDRLTDRAQPEELPVLARTPVNDELQRVLSAAG
jgi:hypothetical protein